MTGEQLYLRWRDEMHSRGCLVSEEWTELEEVECESWTSLAGSIGLPLAPQPAAPAEEDEPKRITVEIEPSLEERPYPLPYHGINLQGPGPEPIHYGVAVNLSAIYRFLPEGRAGQFETLPMLQLLGGWERASR